MSSSKEMLCMWKAVEVLCKSKDIGFSQNPQSCWPFKPAAGGRELVSITYIDKALLCLHFTISLRTYAPLAPICTWQVSCNAYQMLQ